MGFTVFNFLLSGETCEFLKLSSTKRYKTVTFHFIGLKYAFTFIEIKRLPSTIKYISSVENFKFIAKNIF